MEESVGCPRLQKRIEGLNFQEWTEGLNLQEKTEGLNLVLLGKIGAGKSASGNTILGREAFQSRKSFSFVTQYVAVASEIVCGRRVTVYDTPGLFNTKLSEQEIQQMINENVLQRCESGLCVFLLVIKADRFTGKEREAVEKIEELLGKERLKKTWILFTRGDELEKENKSINEFVYETKALMRLVQKYDQRYHVFNNKKREPNGQVQELLTKIYSTYPDTIKKEAKPKQERWVKPKGRLFSSPVAQTVDPPIRHSLSLSSDFLGMQGLMGMPFSSVQDPMEESSMSEDEVKALEHEQLVFRPFRGNISEKEAKPKQERWVKPKGRLFSSPVAHTVDPPIRHSLSLSSDFLEMPFSSGQDPMEESSFTSEEVKALDHEQLNRLLREFISEKGAKPKQERWVKPKGRLFSSPVAHTVDPPIRHCLSLSSDYLGMQGLMGMPFSSGQDPMEESSMSEDEVKALELGPGFVSGDPDQFFGDCVPASPESREITSECFFTKSKACDYASRRIVLLGQTGVGKSAAGNTILGKREFKSIRSTNSVTHECLEKHATVSGRSVSVVDTPGLYHTELKTQELMTEIARSVYLSSPGPHAFLIVFRVDVRFTEHEQQIPQKIKMMFGEEVLKYSIILFTHGDQLEEEFVEKLIVKNSRLRDLVQQCGGRFHVFNNRDVNNRDQVNDLLKKIDTMIEQNGGGHYSNQMIEDPLRLSREERERKQEKQRQEEIERNETEGRIKLKCPTTFQLPRPISMRWRKKLKHPDFW